MMSKLSCEKLHYKNCTKSNILVAGDGKLYIYEHYFIIFNNDNPSSCLLFISNNFKKSLTISGKCELNIISGAIKINGIDYSIPFHETIFSPQTHTKVSLQMTTNTIYKKHNLYDLLQILIATGDYNELQILSLKNSINYFNSDVEKWSLLKLLNFFCLTVDDISQFKNFKGIFEVDISFPFSKILQFSLTLQEEPSYYISTEIEESLNKLIATSKIINNIQIAIVGPKDSGKSTFLRTLTNKLLTNGYDKVCIIDGDPGQSEFSTCGNLSLTIISKPLFGPPFTHQLSTDIDIKEQYFLGLLSPHEDPKFYCRSFERLYQKYLLISQDWKLPLIINTMGWPKGIGLSLLAFKLLLVNPSHIIQLKKGNPNRDLVNITSEFLETFSKTETDLFENLQRRITSTIYILKSPVSYNQNSNLKLKPKDHRDLTMISYLFHKTQNRPLCNPDMLPTDYPNNPVTRLRCRIPIAIKICFQSDKLDDNNYNHLKMLYSEMINSDQLDHLVEGFSLQWVAICRISGPNNYQSVLNQSGNKHCNREEESHLMVCLGMGLVSHIRIDTNELDLLTGVPIDLINGCCLVKGKILPPECLFNSE